MTDRENHPPTAPQEPADRFNVALRELVQPSAWKNPTPADCYDLVVIGAGTAGLVAAAGAAGLGARVAIVERHRMGGDCLNTGCVPSKTLLRSAQAAAELRRAAELGIHMPCGGIVDFPAVMERVRKVRANIAPNDSAQRFAGLGVDVFLGAAAFADGRHVEVNGSRLRFRKAVIATGARTVTPPIPGLAEAGPLTNETVFNLTEQPGRLAIIGGGPVGCELAQAFQRLGSQVTLIHKNPRVLEREDADASEVVQNALHRDGVRLSLGAEVVSVSQADGVKRLRLRTAGAEETIEADAILVATGRTPNVASLNLEAAGVAWDSRDGVRVDDFLRTANPRIYACGDVAMRWKFTHAADFAARIVIQNALFAIGPLGRRRLSTLNMAWCTYTEPELAHTGLTLAEAAKRGIELDTFTQPFESVDRATTESESEGFVRIHVRRGSDKIIGATVVGKGAGDLISEISTAMAGKIGLGRITSIIHPYPTRAEAIRKLGDQFNRRRLTPGTAKMLKLLMKLGR